jgi:putative transposase
MPQRKHKPEEIVAKLRQVDVLVSQGRPVAEAIRTVGVTPFTYYRWRKEFGGLKSDQVKRLPPANTACHIALASRPAIRRRALRSCVTTYNAN